MKIQTFPKMEFFDHMNFVLADARKLHFYSDVNEKEAFGFSSKLSYMQALSNEPIRVYLHTFGGSLYDGLAVYDRIVQTINEGVPVDIVVSGACMSCGLFILQAGRKRQATANTSFLLHELRGVIQGTHGQMEDARKENERIQEVIYKILADRSGLSKTKLRNLAKRKDYFFGADDALKYNFVDEVV